MATIMCWMVATFLPTSAMRVMKAATVSGDAGSGGRQASWHHDENVFQSVL